MPTLNKDGSTRKKYTTKKMIIAKNRKNGQKKAWDKRRSLYPETNGYKPAMVDEEVKATRMPMEAPIKKVDVPEERDYEAEIITAELAQKLADLDDFLNSLPGIEFDRETFIREAITTAIDLRLQIIHHRKLQQHQLLPSHQFLQVPSLFVLQ